MLYVFEISWLIRHSVLPLGSCAQFGPVATGSAVVASAEGVLESVHLAEIPHLPSFQPFCLAHLVVPLAFSLEYDEALPKDQPFVIGRHALIPLRALFGFRHTLLQREFELQEAVHLAETGRRQTHIFQCLAEPQMLCNSKKRNTMRVLSSFDVAQPGAK